MVHDVLLIMDLDPTSVLLLLDLSVVFDTLDQCILLDEGKIYLASLDWIWLG